MYSLGYFLDKCTVKGVDIDNPSMYLTIDIIFIFICVGLTILFLVLSIRRFRFLRQYDEKTMPKLGIIKGNIHGIYVIATAVFALTTIYCVVQAFMVISTC